MIKMLWCYSVVATLGNCEEAEKPIPMNRLFQDVYVNNGSNPHPRPSPVPGEGIPGRFKQNQNTLLSLMLPSPKLGEGQG